jgi:glycerate 2-kinase
LESPQKLLTALFQAALRAAEPEGATFAAVEKLELAGDAKTWLIAFGKAARTMTKGAVAALARVDHNLAGGVVVEPRPLVDSEDIASFQSPTSIDSRLESLYGDHPLPGAASATAATRIGDLVSQIHAGDQVIVLVSGGGSSLIAAPVGEASEITTEDITLLYSTLLNSGLDIRAVNAIRRRFVRWGGGRLAAALSGAIVHCLVVSDVPDDDPGGEVVSSGPCAPDPLFASAVETALKRGGLWPRLPDRLRDYIGMVERGAASETPKPGDPAFHAVTTRIVANNQLALAGAADAARTAGIEEVTIAREPLVGEAAIAGVRLASEIIARVSRARGRRISRCMIWGGETTVTASGDEPGDGAKREGVLGGRSQELALAAARSLGDAGSRAKGITLLAAGTDGRDGPTDAAGAIVDGLTWSAIRADGRDPASDLAHHDAYHALDAAGALLRTGLTGTNVMDVVIGLVL